MHKKVLFPLVLFLSAACGLIVEIVAGRMIAPYVGRSLYSWTAIIAVVLAGLSVGHWIGGGLAGDGASEKQSYLRLAAALGLASVSSLAAVVLLHLLSPILTEGGIGPVTAVLLLSMALFLLPSLFVGIVAPIVTRLAVDVGDGETGPVIGRMYAFGTLGSIAGTLGAGYVFISWIGSVGTILAVTAIYAGLAIACAFAARRGDGLIACLLVLTALVITTIFGARFDAFKSACTAESDYFCIRIEDFSPVSGRQSALMVLDNLVHSINDRDDPSLLYSPYIHFVDEFTRRRFFKRRDGNTFSAFFIGGGGYTLPRSWTATMDSPRLLVAEIDPTVSRVAADRLWLDAQAPGLEIRHRDARELLQSLPNEPQFDVVFGDAFQDISIPAHLVTREFHGEIARRLRPEGFYVLNLVDRGPKPRFLAAMVRTLRADFPEVSVWVEAGSEAGPGQNQARVTYVIVASTLAPMEREMPSLFGIARTWRMIGEHDGMITLSQDAPLLTDDLAPVDRLLY